MKKPANDLPPLEVPRLHPWLRDPTARYTAADGLIRELTGEPAPLAHATRRRGMLTISERMLARTYDTWMTGYRLGQALTGELQAALLAGEHAMWIALFRAHTSPEEILRLAPLARAATEPPHDLEAFRLACQAEWVRQWFELGRPLSLLPYGTTERFITFRPTLAFLGYTGGSGWYLLGEEERFSALNHLVALRQARAWMNGANTVSPGEQDVALLGKIRVEQALMQERARQAVPSLWADYLGALLKADGRLVYEGRVLAWQAGAHHLFTIDGGRWRYTVKAAPRSAARLAVLAKVEQLGRGGSPVGWGEATERLPILLGWQTVQDRYDERGMRLRGTVKTDGHATATVLVVPTVGANQWVVGVQDGEATITRATVTWTPAHGSQPPRVTMVGARTQHRAESVYPPELPLRHALLWAAWRAVRGYEV